MFNDISQGYLRITQNDVFQSLLRSFFQLESDSLTKNSIETITFSFGTLLFETMSNFCKTLQRQCSNAYVLRVEASSHTRALSKTSQWSFCF